MFCLSNFSFLPGASHAEELVARAVQLRYFALALTNECSLTGVVRAHAEAKNAGLPLIIGAHFHLKSPDDDQYGDRKPQMAATTENQTLHIDYDPAAPAGQASLDSRALNIIAAAYGPVDVTAKVAALVETRPRWICSITSIPPVALP